jgi:DNA-binding FadR family transcriptional regulator
MGRMTDISETPSPSPHASSPLSPSLQGSRRPRREKLTVFLVDTLAERIRGGSVEVGAKLPTETQLVEEFGVSRTVVREAIAELRARGLVEARQGVGVFVTRARPTAIGLLDGDFAHLPEILDLLEFRMAVEIEAAGMAALRRSLRQEAEIRAAHDDMARAVTQGDPAVEADFAFHLAIAAATNNRFYGEMLRHLGGKTIPRARFAGGGSAAYLAKVQTEHAAILAAVEDQNAEAARAAMRAHLTESLKRYRALAGAAAAG